MTVTTSVQVIVFPKPSATLQMTVVLPIGNSAGASLMILVAQVSIIVGGVSNDDDAVQVAGSAISVCGVVLQMTVGGEKSDTLINCVHDAVLPLPSSTVHVIVVIPAGNAGGASLVTVVTPQLSATIGFGKGMPKTATHSPGLVDKAIGPRQVIIGGCVSSTVTNCSQVVV